MSNFNAAKSFIDFNIGLINTSNSRQVADDAFTWTKSDLLDYIDSGYINQAEHDLLLELLTTAYSNRGSV